MSEENFNDYDLINTIAVRWLMYNSKQQNKPLCIKFKKEIQYYWFLHMLDSFYVFNNYNPYYIECNFVRYLILRFIKKFKGARKYHRNKDVFKISVPIFISELLKSLTIKVNPNIINSIYNAYYKSR